MNICDLGESLRPCAVGWSTSSLRIVFDALTHRSPGRKLLVPLLGELHRIAAVALLPFPQRLGVERVEVDRLEQ